MDTGLIKLIGPAWAKLIEQPNKHASITNKSQGSRSNNTSNKLGEPAVVNFSGLGNIYKTADQPQQRGLRTREKLDVNFSLLHKKQASKFIRGEDSRRDSRVSQLNNHRKLRRSDLQMARRPDVRAVSPIIEDDSINEDSRMMGSKQTNGCSSVVNANAKRADLTVNKSTNRVASKPVFVAPLEPVKATDRRRQQLLEYQKTKMELAKNKFEGKQRPFKPAGGISVAVPLLTKKDAPAPTITNRNKLVSVEKVSSTINASGMNRKLESERRITRAMAKGGSTATERPNSSAALKPAINQLKNLNINGKLPSNIGNNKVITSENPALKDGLIQQQATQKPVVTPKVPAVAKKTTSPVDASVAMQVEIEQDEKPTVPVMKVVKAKPKAIDGIYAKYNSLFAFACDKLTEKLTYWEKVRSSCNDIPDCVQDDIDAAIGQAKLLLTSKLPQFAQLLWQYIFPAVDDTPPVLNCDLEGWWDVAKIQVSQVEDNFINLKNLQNNDWVEPLKKPLVAAKANKKSLTNPKPKDNKCKPYQPPGVSKFKIFLLNKKAAEAPPQDVKVFDTGLFQIQSPASPALSTPQKRRSMRLSRLVQNGQSQLSTPNADASIVKTPASQRRLSMVQMSMKKSMGSLYRSGVIPGQHDDVSCQNNP